jgi:hypothetical protein
MPRFLRGLGLTLLLLGAAAAVGEVLLLLASGGKTRVSFGSVWYALSANSLVGFQAAVERYLGELAGSILVTLLALPMWLVLGLPGLACWLLARRERRGLG